MDERHNGNPMHDYVRGVEAEVARKYYEIVKDSYQRNRLQLWRKCRWRLSGFSFCKGWADRLCPLDKLVRFSRVRCKHCWRQLRDAHKAETAAQKAVDDVWNKFKTSPEFPVISDLITPDDEPKADASDPLAAHKLARMLGARGECGFESLGESRTQSPVAPEGQQHHHHNILYETVSRLAYIADCNVITRQEVKAASRCGGLPVRPPYLLPRVGMPHVADTEDDLYLTFLVKLQDMLFPNGIEDADNAIFPMTFFFTSNVEKAMCCKAALAAACVAHNEAQGINGRSMKPECFEGGVCATGNISTSE